MTQDVKVEELRRIFRTWLEKNRDTLPVSEVERFSELLEKLDDLRLDASAWSRSNWTNNLVSLFRLIASIMMNDGQS